MKIAGVYSLKRGREIIEADYSNELGEIKSIIAAIDSSLP